MITDFEFTAWLFNLLCLSSKFSDMDTHWPRYFTVYTPQKDF